MAARPRPIPKCRMTKMFACVAFVMVAGGATASDLETTIASCAPSIAPATLRAIVQVESAGNPLAIHVNGPRLARQPRNEAEAITTAEWLVQQGYNFDAGVAQINSANFKKLGVTPQTAFNPCISLAAAEMLLNSDYHIAVREEGQHPVLTTLSRYNTGDNLRGFRNGYVRKVQAAARQQARQKPQDDAPLAVTPIPLADGAKAPMPQPEAKKKAPPAPNPNDVFSNKSNLDVFRKVESAPTPATEVPSTKPAEPQP